MRTVVVRKLDLQLQAGDGKAAGDTGQARDFSPVFFRREQKIGAAVARFFLEPRYVACAVVVVVAEPMRTVEHELS